MGDARYSLWHGPAEPFELAVAPLTQPGPGEVLVAIDLATVCGSDVHTVLGHRPGPAPSILGHEQVGRVIAVGDVLRADRSPVTVGDRVVWSVTASCGSCRLCERGFPQKCLRLRKYGHEPLTVDHPLSGGFASHCLLTPGTTIVAVPEDVPDAVAAPAGCATATVAACFAALPRPVAANDQVLVTGAGMLGLTACALAATAGAAVTLADPDPARRELGAAFGATSLVVDASEAGEVDVAIELSGHPGAVEGALASLGIGGTLVLAGSVSDGRSVGVDPQRVVRSLLTIVGVHNYRPADLVTAVGFLAAHHRDYPFAELVAPPYPLERVGDAVAAATASAKPRQSIRP